MTVDWPIRDRRCSPISPIGGWVIRPRREDGLPIRSRVERKWIASSRIGQSVLQVKAVHGVARWGVGIQASA